MGGGRRDSATRRVRRLSHWLAAPLLLLTAAGSIVAAPADDSQILYFEPLRIIESAVPTQEKATRTRELQFDAYGRRFVLTLQPNDKLSPLLQSKSGTAAVELYKGQINGAANSWARVSIVDGQLHGMLWDGAELYVIEPVAKLRDALPTNTPADSNTTAIFRLADVVMKPGAASCGTDTTKASKGADAYESLVNELKNAPAVMQAAGATRRLEVSALGDMLFMNRYGTEARARSEILQRLNYVDGIFSSQLGVELQVPSVDIGDSLSATTSSSSLLDELADLRKRSANLYSRGLTHLFTGRDLDGSTVGIAYLDSLCSREFGAGLSEASGRSLWTESLIAAHEIGHNFGAVHDGEQGKACASTPTGQFLMSSSITSNDQFSACSLNSIRPNIPGASCITALAAADIAVAANLGVVQRPVGQPFEWNLTVRNSGGVATTNARAEILVPPVVEIEDAYVLGGSCTSGAGVIMCQLGQIAGGDSAVVHLSLRSDVVGANSVSVEVSADNEVQTNNNRGEGTLRIEPESDLAVTLQAPTSVATGNTFNVSLSATNLSVIDANEITVSLELPAGISASSATFNGASCVVQTAGVSCSLASLAAGATVNGTAVLSASTPGTSQIQARIAGSYVDPVASNDVAQTSVSVTGTMSSSTQSARSGGGGGSTGAWLLAALLGLLGLKNLPRRPTPTSG